MISWLKTSLGHKEGHVNDFFGGKNLTLEFMSQINVLAVFLAHQPCAS